MVAFDGTEAISMVEQEPPSVILLDIGLPGMDGYSIARALRANTSLAHVTLIALTGYGQPADLLKSKEAGFDHHLVKPIQIDRLLDIFADLPATQANN
jgi:two-component system, chemotaxis family, CheB/CheR fusion protein